MVFSNKLLRPRATGGDPYWSAVSLLLHLDSATADSSGTPKTVVAYGNASISTAHGVSGGASLYVDGSGDYLRIDSLPFNWSSDFTLEFWFRRNGLGTGAVHTVFEAGNIASGAGGVHVYVDNQGAWSVNDGYAQAIEGGQSPLGVWIHCALVRSNGVNTLYIDGISVGQSTQDYGSLITNGIVSIGGAPNYGFYADAYIDEVRLTQVARYGGLSFAVPLPPFHNG